MDRTRAERYSRNTVSWLRLHACNKTHSPASRLRHRRAFRVAVHRSRRPGRLQAKRASGRSERGGHRSGWRRRGQARLLLAVSERDAACDAPSDGTAQQQDVRPECRLQDSSVVGQDVCSVPISALVCECRELRCQGGRRCRRRSSAIARRAAHGRQQSRRNRAPRGADKACVVLPRCRRDRHARLDELRHRITGHQPRQKPLRKLGAQRVQRRRRALLSQALAYERGRRLRGGRHSVPMQSRRAAPTQSFRSPRAPRRRSERGGRATVTTGQASYSTRLQELQL